MNEIEKKLLREAIGDADPKLCIRSATCIDTGRWWRRSPIWLCCVIGDELIMLAVSRRRYLEKVSLTACTSCHYSQASGELVIAPAENLRVNRLKVSPREAIQILRIINPASLASTSQNK